ncbi:nuclear transport factor 2 family protein [Candidatus Lokiarchaeum ossiferum]|uniref:nuclear transport factor 2 family protein n=1 Tax=Candidatus Lokiarchaeum ossiferum TaxID=2951803 RepID=UPI00352FBA67
MSLSIIDKEQLCELWTNIYNTDGKPDWSHIIPYYDEKIIFRDSIQTIHGIEEFKQMTERLVQRSKDLKMKIVNSVKEENIIFLEWEMNLSFGKYPNSTMYGSSRLTLNEAGKIIDQRDYYDLWGDIFDNIPKLAKRYRKFMRKKFG